jgi:hypothetical protein
MQQKYFVFLVRVVPMKVSKNIVSRVILRIPVPLSPTTGIFAVDFFSRFLEWFCLGHLRKPLYIYSVIE